MALTTTTALSYYQQESSGNYTEWTNPINFSLEALSADDVEVCVINSQAAEGFQKLTLIKDTDYTLDFASKTVTCTSSAWGDISKIANHSANHIRIFRATSITELVDFTNGAVLSAEDLNLAYKQNLFAAQEMNEDAGHTRGGIQSVSETALADSSVATAKIQNNAVTSDKIAADAVIAAKIASGAVTTAKLAAEAVTEEKIETEAVTTNKLENDAVTTVKIEDEAVTYDKVKAASKAQMEGQLGTGTHGGETAGVVTPDVLKNSPLVPKCYGVVSYDGNTPSLSSGSFNVASVSEPSDDKRTVTFTTPLQNASYVVLATMQTAAAVGDYEAVSITAKATSSFTMESRHNESADLSINFVVFGSTYVS
jgi:hypothetical protein